MSFALAFKDAAGNPSVYTFPINSNVSGASWQATSDTPANATVAMDSTGQNVEATLVAPGNWNLTVTDSSGKAPQIGPIAFTNLDNASPPPAPFAHLDLDGAGST